MKTQSFAHSGWFLGMYHGVSRAFERAGLAVLLTVLPLYSSSSAAIASNAPTATGPQPLSPISEQSGFTVSESNGMKPSHNSFYHRHLHDLYIYLTI